LQNKSKSEYDKATVITKNAWAGFELMQVEVSLTADLNRYQSQNILYDIYFVLIIIKK